MDSTGGGWWAWATGSVRRQITVMARGTVVMLAIVAAVSAAAVLWSASALNSLNDVAVPLQTANKEVLQDVTDAEAALRGWALDGKSESLTTYEIAISHLPKDEQVLRELADGDDALMAAVAAQEAATDDWIRRYVLPAVNSADAEQFGPGRDARQARLFQRGNRLFDDVRSANAAVDEAVDVAVTSISEDSRTLLFWTLTGVVLFPLAMIAFAALAGRRLHEATAGPFDDVSEVLGRLREGDLTARAAEAGPLEIREIAAAINELAEENLRSRDVEDVVATQLDEIDRVRAELVSTVSHELRTPLTCIQGYLELMEDDLTGLLDERQALMFDSVRRNVDRLAELVANLLTLSRVEEVTLRVEPLDLRGVAVEVVGDLRLMAASRGVTLRAIHSATPVLMFGDRAQIARALTNLATNAVKFSPSGSTVEVRVSEHDRVGHVEVVDEGIGIPAAELERIGQRFFRASNAMREEIPGTGLGLRIVQAIADRHGGRLVVDSLEGVGTTVTLSLPLTPGHDLSVRGNGHETRRDAVQGRSAVVTLAGAEVLDGPVQGGHGAGRAAVVPASTEHSLFAPGHAPTPPEEPSLQVAGD